MTAIVCDHCGGNPSPVNNPCFVCGASMKPTTKAPRVIQCAHLIARDFDQAPDNTVIVCTSRASNFRVVRQSPGVFIVHGKAEFVGGSTVVRGIDAVRRLLSIR